MTAWAAIVLAGGTARRMSGLDKPALPIGGTPLLLRVLSATGGAWPTVVVGPWRSVVPYGVLTTREEPAGTGPVAALAAGLRAVESAVLAARPADPHHPADASGPDAVGPDTSGPDAGGPVPGTSADDPALVAVLAADLPFLTPAALAALRARVAAEPGIDGAVAVDAEALAQNLCGVWRIAALTQAVRGEPAAGRSMRSLLAGLRVAEMRLPEPTGAPPPWWDVDTTADAEMAQRWT